MPLEISAELQPFVERELKTGRYRSEQELVDYALRLLRQERDAAIAGIQMGLADVEAGREQSLHDAFSDLRLEFGLVDEP